MVIFATVNDLRNHISDRMSEYSTYGDIERVVEIVRHSPSFPEWGQDVSEYLATLPDFEMLLRRN